MAIETPDIYEHNFATGETSMRKMTEQEFSDYLETLDFIEKNPTL
jgi:hypothetical protein